MLALARNALTTYEAMASQLKLVDPTFDDQDELVRKINVASALIENYCRRRFAYAAVDGELVRATTGQRLQVQLTPVDPEASISISNAGQVLDPTTYSLESAEHGFFWKFAGWFPRDLIVSGSTAMDSVPNSGRADIAVSYSGGYVLPKDDGVTPIGATAPLVRTLPDEVEQACWMAVEEKWRRRGTTYGGTNAEKGKGPSTMLPPDVMDMLASYVRW
jgi:hypothetical protein